MVFDNQPAISVFDVVFVLMDDVNDVSELLADLHYKGDAAIERIVFDFVDDGNGCELGQVGNVVFFLLIVETCFSVGCAVLDADGFKLIEEMGDHAFVVCLPNVGTVVEGGESVGYHLSGFCV